MSETGYIDLKDINCYKISYHLSNELWRLVIKWGYLERNTVGIQLVRAADSISANIAEGYGRYGKKDKIRFYRIAYGSCMETKDWMNKSKDRNLIEIPDYKVFIEDLENISRSINKFIQITNEKLKF